MGKLSLLEEVKLDVSGNILIKRIKYSGMTSLLFRFLTPFPPRPPQRISEGQWVEKTVWKAERAWFLAQRKRRAKPGIEPILTRWGKSGVFSESTGLSFLRHTRHPTLSGLLEKRFRKAKPEKVASAIPEYFIIRLNFFPA